MSLRRVVPKNYDHKGERFLISSRFPPPPLACAFFIPRATVKQMIIVLSSPIRTRNSFTYDPIPESFNEVQSSPNPPPQYHFNIYLCRICKINSHYGYECSQRVPLVYELEPCYIQNFNDNDYSHDLPANYESDSSDYHSCSDEDFSEEIYSNPLFEEEIISMKIDQHHFNAESGLIESMLNRDSSIIPSSSKIDSILDKFAGELTLLKSILPGIDKFDCYPEEEIHLTERLLYDNSSPRPPKEFVYENSDADIESFFPYPIPVEDSDSFMEEIDLFLTPNDLVPPGIEEDDDESERDMLIHKELLDIYSLSLPVIESFYFDIPFSSSCKTTRWIARIVMSLVLSIFVFHSQELHILSFILGIPVSKSYGLTFFFWHT
nr:hypothetical protein [Tanacetum cinerariifolium]